MQFPDPTEPELPLRAWSQLMWVTTELKGYEEHQEVVTLCQDALDRLKAAGSFRSWRQQIRISLQLMTALDNLENTLSFDLRREFRDSVSVRPPSTIRYPTYKPKEEPNIMVRDVADFIRLGADGSEEYDTINRILPNRLAKSTPSPYLTGDGVRLEDHLVRYIHKRLKTAGPIKCSIEFQKLPEAELARLERVYPEYAAKEHDPLSKEEFFLLAEAIADLPMKSFRSPKIDAKTKKALKIAMRDMYWVEHGGPFRTIKLAPLSSPDPEVEQSVESPDASSQAHAVPPVESPDASSQAHAAPPVEGPDAPSQAHTNQSVDIEQDPRVLRMQPPTDMSDVQRARLLAIYNNLNRDTPDLLRGTRPVAPGEDSRVSFETFVKWFYIAADYVAHEQE